MTESNDTELDLTSISIGDDENDFGEMSSIGLDAGTEEALLELGSDVYMIIDDEDEVYGDMDQLSRITIDEMVKGMGLSSVEPLTLGYDFDEYDEEDMPDISGIDLTGLAEEVDLSSISVIPGKLMTDLEEKTRTLPYSNIYWSQSFNESTQELKLKEPVSLHQVAKNYVGADDNMASIIAAQDRYKTLLTGALNGLVAGLYDSIVHNGVLTYLRNNTGIEKVQKSVSGSSIDDAIKYLLDYYFVDKNEDESGAKNKRRMYKAQNGVLFEPDDNAIATKIVDLLIEAGFLSSNIRANGANYADVKDKIMHQIDATFYDRDMATKAGSVKLRDWFKDAVDISSYLIFTLVYYPMAGKTEEIPLIKTERAGSVSEDDYNRAAGQSFKIVFRDNRGSTTTVDASKVFDWRPDNEYFRLVPDEPPMFLKELAGITEYNYIDPNEELDFILHKIFALGSYKGLKGTGTNTKLVMKCDCGDNYVEITPNLQSIIYFLSNNNSYQVQLMYTPVICPYCGRVMLVERELLDSIKERLSLVLRGNSGESAKFIAGKQRNYGFKLIPPHMFSFSNNETEELLQIEEETEDDPDVFVTSKYESADLTRQIKDYENALAKFRARKNKVGAMDKSNFAYLVCKVLMEDYDKLKTQSVNSILSSLVNEGIISTIDSRLKDSLLSYWNKDTVGFEEYEENLELILTAANKDAVDETNVIPMDLLRQSPDAEALKVSPKETLDKLPLEDRWDFLRLICMRYFPEEKIDMTGWEDTWLIKYQEIGEKINSMQTVEDMDSIVNILNNNLEQIACGGAVSVPVDYRLFTRYFRNEKFLDFLDKASDLMLLTGLCDKLIRYLLRTPKEFAVYIAKDCDIDQLVDQLKKKVLDKMAPVYNDAGEQSSRLDGLYFYRLFKAVDGTFADDMEKCVPTARKATVRSYINNKWAVELETFKQNVCVYDDIEELSDILHEWVQSFKYLDAQKFLEKTNEMKQIFLTGNQKLIRSRLFGKIYRIADELCGRGDYAGAEECLAHAKKFYNTEILLSNNLILCIVGFKEMASSALLEMLFEYYNSATFFEAYMLYVLGISIDSITSRPKGIKDYIMMEANEDYDFQMFLLNMIYPISEMNYVTEQEQEDDTMNYSDDFLARHTSELVNEHYTELLNVLPKEYKPFLGKYLGEE